jgi:leader peptidase (prepilin peptidase)/N-methyltransferase
MALMLVISLFLFVLGAAVGSFLNVVLYRSILGQDWVHGRSRCDNCHKQIKWYDNIPLLSYFLLRGTCRYCKEPIALSHPVVEFLTGLLFVWWYWGGSLFFQLTQAPFTALQPLFWLSVGVLLIMIFMADLLYLLIPDVAVGLLLLMTILYRVGLTLAGIMEPMDLLKAVMGMVLAVSFFGGLWLLTKGKGMGFGDVKLVGPLALLLGWPNILVGLFIAFVLGALTGLVMIALGKRKMGQVLPFGPFLVIGTVFALVVGDQLLSWYVSLI